jgi:O-antigen/teichoic acid export membrane protein
MVATCSTAEANRLTPAACRHTMFLTAVSAVTCATLGPFAIRYLYGDAFAGAITPLLILLPGVLMLSQAHIFYSDLNGRGKPEVTTLSALAALILTIVLDLVLIPRYGITGAAVASTCAYTAEFAVAGSFFVHHTGLTWREILVFRKSDLHHYYRVARLTMSH